MAGPKRSTAAVATLGDAEHGVRVAYAHGSDLDLLSVDFKEVGVSLAIAPQTAMRAGAKSGTPKSMATSFSP
jgi:hypothetical protein